MTQLSRRSLLAASVGLVAATALVACDQGDESPDQGPDDAMEERPPATSELSGTILADGSSTVGPVTQAVAEEFTKLHPKVRIPVGVSGSGGGFKKFCIGETDLSNASRHIKETEIATCTENGIGFTELAVAFDGLAVLANPSADWVDCLTVEELQRIWSPEAEDEVTRWSQVRDGFPDKELVLYGPGVDSGTFDYFTEVINGEEGLSRGDFTPSEDDNVLVQGISGDATATGFMGLAYYSANADRLKLIPVDGGAGCISPSEATVNDGTYAPLSRPLFFYVSNLAAERPEVEAFIHFYLENARHVAADVGYVAMPDAMYAEQIALFDSR
jgi:phosphate transport system substrate-binding protein